MNVGDFVEFEGKEQKNRSGGKRTLVIL